MIRVRRAQEWLRVKAVALRPHAALLLSRLRALIATIARGLRRAAGALLPRVRRAGDDVGRRLRPLGPVVEPRVQRIGRLVPAVLTATLAGVLPVMARSAGAIRHQMEAGRDARATPRELRDVRGRRLRASAYIFGPDGSRDPRRRARRTPGVAGSLLPTGVKVAMVGLLAGAAFLSSSSVYINYAADLPDAHAITSEPLDEDSLIYAGDGTLLADIHQLGLQHYYEPLDQMGRWLPEATVAVEDANFWDEPGIDVFGIARAAWVDWREKQAVQGASTITQQLVKLRLIGNSPTIERKIKEAVLAIQVEHTYSKQKILEQYLNAVPYSNNAQGSLAGARIYFHKETKDLTLAQASMLAGIPQSPFYNAPLSHWDQARKRQLQVLQAMVRKKLITQEQADEAYAEDLSSPAHMFTSGQQVLAAPGFVSWVVGTLVARYGQKTTYGGGLRVHTTLNMQLQRQAEQAVVDGVNANRGRGVNQGAMTAIDPRTGAVLAMVGSADPNQHGGQFNMAVEPRNPGSSMKIYNYTAAIESGRYTMVTPVPDTPLTIRYPPGSIPPTYSPKNYDLRSHGVCQLQQCMGNSLNVPAVKVEITIGVDRVVDMARRMGAPPLYPHYPDNGAPYYTTDDPPSSFGYSLTLGGYGETTLQMATGAATLGAQGVMHPPFAIASIEASDGAEVFKASDPSKGARQAMDPRVAFIMEQIMSDNDNRVMIFGPNSPLILPGRRVAAKTGTTDDFTDGWTVGYTPSLASAFWFGDPSFKPLTPGSDGVFVAAPSWHQFMQAALDILKAPPGEWFSEPAGLGHATVNGKPVWLMPGTSPTMQMPPLPSFASSSSAPPPAGGQGQPGEPRRPGG